jgi:hypothetical protein
MFHQHSLRPNGTKADTYYYILTLVMLNPNIRDKSLGPWPQLNEPVKLLLSMLRSALQSTP